MLRILGIRVNKPERNALTAALIGAVPVLLECQSKGSAFKGIPTKDELHIIVQHNDALILQVEVSHTAPVFHTGCGTESLVPNGDEVCKGLIGFDGENVAVIFLRQGKFVLARHQLAKSNTAIFDSYRRFVIFLTYIGNRDLGAVRDRGDLIVLLFFHLGVHCAERNLGQPLLAGLINGKVPIAGRVSAEAQVVKTDLAFHIGVLSGKSLIAEIFLPGKDIEIRAVTHHRQRQLSAV